MPRPTPVLVLSEHQQKQIEQWLAALGTPQQVALRGRIVLAAGHGKSEAAIAAEMDINRKTVRLWRERFFARGLSGLWESAPGPGRQGPSPSGRIKKGIEDPPQSQTRRTNRSSLRLPAPRP